MSLTTEPRAIVDEMVTLFERMIRLTLEIAEIEPVSEPPEDLAPCWHACQRLRREGYPAAPDEAVAKAAFWEWLAWAAEEFYGEDADDFANECRAIADVAVLA